jgi:putative two-component system response regulator
MKRDTILIADDIEMDRLILAQLFSADFNIIQAKNGEEVLTELKQSSSKIAVILLDVIMPKMGGLEVLKRLKQINNTKNIPVIFITGDSDDNPMIHEAYDMGVAEIISKPIEKYSTTRRVLNIINLFNEKYELQETNEVQQKRINHTNEIIIETIATMVETRAGDEDTGKHILNIKKYTHILLTYLNKTSPTLTWTNKQINEIVLASAFHDIGKILIPESILLKPGKLTPEEFEDMKKHTIYGCEVLKNLKGIAEGSFYQYCYDICLHHHEKWDGKGYWDGLSENEIPPHAHIVALADVYDALTHKRVYKNAFSHETTIKMIKNGECGVFAPWLLTALDAVKDQFKANLEID